MKNPRLLFGTVAIAFSGLLAGISAALAQANGGDLEAEATVTVKPAADGASAPRLSLEPFPLGQVMLNPDEQQRATQFMKNRDKFIRGLAATYPDRFLHTFRNAFGQQQPEGARPLRGWERSHGPPVSDQRRPGLSRVRETVRPAATAPRSRATPSCKTRSTSGARTIGRSTSTSTSHPR